MWKQIISRFEFSELISVLTLLLLVLSTTAGIMYFFMNKTFEARVNRIEFRHEKRISQMQDNFDKRMSNKIESVKSDFNNRIENLNDRINDLTTKNTELQDINEQMESLIQRHRIQKQYYGRAFTALDCLLRYERSRQDAKDPKDGSEKPFESFHRQQAELAKDIELKNKREKFGDLPRSALECKPLNGDDLLPIVSLETFEKRMNLSEKLNNKINIDLPEINKFRKTKNPYGVEQFIMHTPSHQIPVSWTTNLEHFTEQLVGKDIASSP